MSDRDDDLSALLARREHARPNRLTWVLMTLLVLVVGFIGGAFANQKFGTTASSSGAGGFPANLPAGFPGAGGFPGTGQTGGSTATAQGGAAGAFGNATFGTVTLVDGTNLYITTLTGQTVKVKVPESAKVTSQTSVALSDLPSGATVIVRGDKAPDGTVTATTVSEGALPGGGPPGAQGATTTNSTPTSPGGN